MMANVNKHHSNEWKRTFGNIGSGLLKDLGTATRMSLSDMAPGTFGAITSSAQVMRDARNSISNLRTQVTQQGRALKRTLTGRDAARTINNAFNDIREGTFDMGRITGEAYDSMDMFDSQIEQYDMDMANSDDPDMLAMTESKKNTAMLGRAIAQGNAATIEGLDKMTSTLANVQLKATDAQTKQLQNVLLTNSANVNSKLIGITSKIDAVNSNLMAIMDFHRKNTAIVNKSTLEYQKSTTMMLGEIGQGMAEIRDFLQFQRDLIEKKNQPMHGARKRSQMFDFSGGFNANDYIDMVKKNFKTSSVGLSAGMYQMMLPMMMMGGESPIAMAMSMVLPNLLPSNMRKSIGRFDKSISHGIDNALRGLGRWRNSSNDFKKMIGEIFGIREESLFKGIDTSNFKKDSMGWNGIAQKTLVEVIPGYLARIESALTKQDERFFDMEKGKFRTRRSLEREYRETHRNALQWSANDLTDQVKRMVGGDTANRERIMDSVSALYMRALRDPENVDMRATLRQIEQIMKRSNKYGSSGGFTNKEIHDVQRLFKDAIGSAKNDICDVQDMFDSAGAYRNLFNEEGRNTDHLHNFGNVFAERKEFIRNNTSWEAMTNFEREKYKKEHDKWLEAERKRSSSGDNSEYNWFYFQNEVDKEVNKYFKRLGLNKVAEKANRATNAVSGKIDSASDWVYSRSLGSTNSADISFVDDLFKKSGDKALFTNISDATTVGIARGLKASGGNKEIVSRLDKIVYGVQSMTNIMRNGFFGSSKGNRHRGRHNARSNTRRQQSRVNQTIHSTTSNLNDVVNMPASQIEHDAKEASAMVSTALVPRGNAAMIHGSDEDDEAGPNNALIERLEDNENSLKALVVSLNNNFLKPVVGGIFGKDGFFRRIFTNDTVKKFIKSLFDEDEGVFGSVTSWAKDRKAELRHLIDGKGFTRRDETEVASNRAGSLFGKVSSGYHFVRSNTMKYLFGDDYANNETYQKYLSWTAGKSGDNIAGFNIDNDNAGPGAIGAAVNDITDELAEKGSKIVEATVGGDDAPKKIESSYKKASQSFMQKMKEFLPVGLAGAGIGAAVGFSTMLHGTGLLGGLFLPGGPVGGAVLGIAGALLSRSEKFKDFLFGKEDDNGKRVGGIITEKQREAFKKSLPLVVGSATVGAITSIAKGAVGLGGNGLLFGTLLPGGPLGGAILGLGMGLLKNNDRFNEILWGKQNKDGTRGKGILTGANSMWKKVMESSGDFIKGGAGGILAGLGTGFALSKMGILGGALAAGGPVMWGLTGLGIGIASQTERFKTLLFGDKEDENGKRTGDGLLSKAANMLSINVFEPIRESLQYHAEDFAQFLKKNISYPFREAFGPIADSLHTIKVDIKDAIRNAFNNIATTVSGAFKIAIKDLFGPITSGIGKLGKGAVSVATAGLKFTLLPVSGGLNLLKLMTGSIRNRARKGERKTLLSFEGLRTMLGGAWNEAKARNAAIAEEGGFGGPLGGLNRLATFGMNLFGGFNNAWGAAKQGYRDEMAAQGFNSFGWRSVDDERKALNKQRKKALKDRKQWNKIGAISKELAASNGYANLRLSETGVEDFKARLKRADIDSSIINSIETSDDINELVYHRGDFKNRLLEGKEKEQIPSQQAQFYNTMSEYMKPVYRFFTQRALEQSLERKKKINIDDMRKMNARMRAVGLTWSDLGYNITEKLDFGSMSGAEFDSLLNDIETEKGLESTSKRSVNEILESMLNIQISQLQADHPGEVSEDDIKKARQGDTSFVSDKLGKVKSKLMRIAKISEISKARRQKEEEEEKAAAEGAESFQDEEDEKKEKGASLLDLKNLSVGALIKEKSKSIFSGITGFFGNLFGGLGSLLGNGKFWLAAIGGTALVATFWEPLSKLFGTLWEKILKPYVVKPVGEKLKWFFGEKVPELFNKASDWMTKNGPEMFKKVLNGLEGTLTAIGTFLVKCVTALGDAIADRVRHRNGKTYNFDSEELTKEAYQNYMKDRDKELSEFKESLGQGPGPGILQSDPRWGSIPIGVFPNGQVSTMATGGCGPTALSMIAEGFGPGTSPVEVASYAMQNGMIQGGGATSDLFTKGASDMGLQSHALNKGSLRRAIGSGQPVIVSGKSTGAGPYTSAGHIVAVHGTDSRGNAIVGDPMRGTRSVPIDKLTSGMTHGWSYSRGIGYGGADQGYSTSTSGVGSYSANIKNVMSARTRNIGGLGVYSDTNKDISNINWTENLNTIGRLKTYQAIRNKILAGYNIDRSANMYNFNKKQFYVGLAVADLKAMAEFHNIYSSSTGNSNGLNARDKGAPSSLDNYNQMKKTGKGVSSSSTNKKSESSAFKSFLTKHFVNPFKALKDNNAMNGTSNGFIKNDWEASRENLIVAYKIYAKACKNKKVKAKSKKELGVPAVFSISNSRFTNTNMVGLNPVLMKYKEDTSQNLKALYLSDIKTNNSKAQSLIQVAINIDPNIQTTERTRIKAVTTLSNASLYERNSFENITTSNEGNGIGYGMSTDSSLGGISSKIKSPANARTRVISSTNGDSLKVVPQSEALRTNLLTDNRIPLFAVIYNAFCNGTYADDYVITSSDTDPFTSTDVNGNPIDVNWLTNLGGTGWEGDWAYKYGFPFYHTTDERWGDRPWRGTNVSQRGSDLASLAMVATAFSGNHIHPAYIIDNWLKENPGWLNSSGGLDMDAVFSNTGSGFNAMGSTQQNGKRLGVQKLINVSSILSALQANKPVVMTGRRDANSIWSGGVGKTGSADDIATVVGRSASGSHMALLNPHSTLDQNDIFGLEALKAAYKSGSNASAYAIMNPDGTGIEGPVDMASLAGGDRDYVDMKKAKGLGKIIALFQNIAAVASHLFDALLGDGVYKSIFDYNKIEGDELNTSAAAMKLADEFAPNTKKDANGATIIDNYTEVSSKTTVISDYASTTESLWYISNPVGYNINPSNNSSSSTVTGKVSTTKTSDVLKSAGAGRIMDSFIGFGPAMVPVKTSANNSMARSLQTDPVMTPVYNTSSALPSAGAGKYVHLNVTTKLAKGTGYAKKYSSLNSAQKDIINQSNCKKLKTNTSIVTCARDSKYLKGNDTSNKYYVTVTSVTPKGEIAPRTVIRFDPASKSAKSKPGDAGINVAGSGGVSRILFSDLSLDKYSNAVESTSGYGVGGGRRSFNIGYGPAMVPVKKSAMVPVKTAPRKVSSSSVLPSAGAGKVIDKQRGNLKDRGFSNSTSGVGSATAKFANAADARTTVTINGVNTTPAEIAELEANNISTEEAYGIDASAGYTSGYWKTVEREVDPEEVWKKMTLFERLNVVTEASMARWMGDSYEDAKKKIILEKYAPKYGFVSGSEEVWVDENGNESSGYIITTADGSTYSGGSTQNGSAAQIQVSTDGSALGIWSALRAAGFTKEGAAGVMGNLYAESGLRANNLQNSYEKSFGLSDSSYTTGVDNGTYANFIHDKAGYGLAQWTSAGRKQNLLNYARSSGKSIGDTDMQTAFLLNEMKSAYPSVYKIATTTTSVKAASDAMLHDFEKPKDQSAAVEAVRLGYSNSFLNQYGNSTGATSVGANGITVNLASPSVTGSVTYNAGGSNKDWMNVVKSVKQAIASSGLTYNQNGYLMLNIFGNSLRVRRDCSGYVSACVTIYTGKTFSCTSRSLLGSNPQLLLAGFTPLAFPGWDHLKEGDILSKAGHTEIYAGSGHMVYSCGSTKSLQTPGATTSGSTSYDIVWRPAFSGMGTADAIMKARANAETPTVGANSIQSAKAQEAASLQTEKKSSWERLTDALDKHFGSGRIGNGPGMSPQSYFSRTLGGGLTAGYGPSKSPLGNYFHRGIDIGSAYGRPITSPVSGTVVASGYDPAGYGNYTVIQDRAGNSHVFGHMGQTVGYGIGTTIGRGMPLGTVGMTGNTTGPHLHYEIRKNGSAFSSIDPTKFNYKTLSSSGSGMKNITPGGAIGGNNAKDFTAEVRAAENNAKNTDSISKQMTSVVSLLGTNGEGLANNTKSMADKLDTLITLWQEYTKISVANANAQLAALKSGNSSGEKKEESTNEKKGTGTKDVVSTGENQQQQQPASSTATQEQQSQQPAGKGIGYGIGYGDGTNGAIYGNTAQNSQSLGTLSSYHRMIAGK